MHSHIQKCVNAIPMRCSCPATYVTDLYLGPYINTLAPGQIGDFRKKYLRSGTSYGPGRSVKKRSKSCLRSKKFFLGGVVFFVSDVISGRLLGHLGPLCLALGTNRQVVVFR